MYSTQTLLDFLTLRHLNRRYDLGDRLEICWEINDELAKRPGDLPLLMHAFLEPADGFQKEMVAEALRRVDNPEVLVAFRKHPVKSLDRTTWCCLQYRSERGDKDALGILNDNYFRYPVSSAEWSETAVLFGRHGCREAASNLLSSMDSACLNLVCSAQWSLERLFPGPHPDFDTLDQAREYFGTLVQGTCESSPR